PPETEYVLFDSMDIELRSVALQSVRETGYRTTVADARERLASAGITVELAHASAAALLPALAGSYARGAARKAVPLLGPAELFDGYVYDAQTKSYQGLWLDLRALASDVTIPNASAILQAMSLVTLLEEAPSTAEIHLSTMEYTQDRRAGERSHRRISLKNAALLPEALRMLAPRTGAAAESSRTGWELVEILRKRGMITAPRFTKIQEAMAVSEPPPRGPLADPLVWEIETALSAGETDGVVERIEALERARGRQPATIYLRSRATLMLGSEAPEIIAERLSQLSSSHSFAELELLTAQAWWAAGKPARALPFARDILSNPSTSNEVRARAELIVARASITEEKLAAERRQLSTPPVRPAQVMHPSDMIGIPQEQRRTAPPGAPQTQPGKRDSGDGYFSGLDLEWDEPIAKKNAGIGSGKHAAINFGEPQPSTKRGVSSAPPATVRQGDSSVPAVLMGGTPAKPWMQGASMPPFRSDFPPAIPHAGNPLPRFEPRPPEAAETLSLPPGLHGQSAVDGGGLPRTTIEARIAFTHLSRELGREYRLRTGRELRTDLEGLELMQMTLRETFPDGVIRTQEEALFVRKHGAFLAELLARSLGAEWSDIAPSELGYWAMIVPPSTRVWPFGRVLRFLSVGTKERDLVSYYLELVARGRP
ncbi:MAG: hypothetical protein ABIP39_09595, partial [Polyangiaceae bacterium]